jgi:hypothetical protein
MNTALKTTFSALAIAATGGFAQAQISFQAPVNYTVGTQPDVTAIGDLDGDGDADLATATDAPDKLSLLFNTGNGTFTGPVNIPLANGTSPYAPVIGDLDGDGDLDIAVTLKSTNQVQIVVNNGGTFTPGATFSVGAEPRDMDIADFDNDGDLDLVCSNRSGNNISVLRNNGGSSFTVTSYAAGIQPREVAVGDVTGDGLVDIAVAAHDSRQVIVFRNTGGAAFVQHVTLSPGNEKPEGVFIARLDGNTTFDIVATADINDVQFAWVFLNNGATFGGGTPFNLGGGINTGSIVAGDFDLDGDNDIATANQGSANISVLANNGAGSFGAAQVIGVGSQPNHIVAGFLDGNNGLDLVTANEGSANVSVLVNNAGVNACSVSTYCQGKVNSQGGVASIGSTGTPSTTTQNFVITITGALPNTTGLLFYGTNGAVSTPFNGGTLCVSAPQVRVGIHQMVGGATTYPIAVTPAMAGTTRWFQFFYRDPFHVDGTNVGLSNALRVDFCQ